ncbi:hypothetical protein A2767_05000 [Candidatus Roizmanbacteria bacterium RIFCSPHIGHO2_01_FULL_35_10]|uniref:Uncharacterized protein n=1 Tax=Candidatus Roizmanbacteria bacterium RIFCSPLOWO2_01_FULL_35_13 TaxID=1802055 RepID=A0A1F7I8K6_9BACT|nr:MAG: hypothetical protein A2767_05000 [Candidatus Roizmanbacteria bacterium RIFCSPHIGHO2_01_FULL_35_10]OGK39696.1 MAG: hypothetical protein A3A74_04335 [Candidatus Roizmanbacteria bacterium RIFCSPLOWO2_01_FULL_35_13]
MEVAKAPILEQIFVNLSKLGVPMHGLLANMDKVKLGGKVDLVEGIAIGGWTLVGALVGELARNAWHHLEKDYKWKPSELLWPGITAAFFAIYPTAIALKD